VTSTTVEAKPSSPYRPTFWQGMALATFTVAISLVVYLIAVLTGAGHYNDRSPQPMITDNLPSCWITTTTGWHYMRSGPCNL
jgi:hypothetical protein